MDEDDVHFCMKCKSEIHGLEQYIKHRKEGCPGATKASPVKAAPPDDEEAGDATTAARDDDQENHEPIQEEKPIKAERRKRGRPKRTHKLPKAVAAFVNIDELPEVEFEDDETYQPPEVAKPKGRPRGRPKGSKTTKSTSTVSAKKPAKTYRTRKRQILECDLCNFMTSTEKRLLAHTRSPMHQEKVAREQGGDRIFNCMFCSESFCLDKALRAHSRVHNAKPYCHECGVFFPTKTALTKHLGETGHKTKYSCEICDKEFQIEGHLKVHMTVHMTEKPYECKQCSFKTKRRADLNIHVKRHMGIKPFKCTLCPFKSVKRSVLTRHMETHKDRPRDLICEICGAAYCSKMVLQHHIFTQHQNGRRYPCTYEGCTYIFCYKSELNAHMRSHTKEKPFLCSICGYEGSNTYALTKHNRIHTKEKPFVCPFPSCNYASRFSAHLVRHKRLHTGEKPYKCPFCNYRCNAQENLRKHVRNTKKHNGKDMYSCNKCEGYTTNSYKDLVHHTRAKHGDQYVKLQDVSRSVGIFQPGVTGDNSNIVEQAIAESMVGGLPEDNGNGQVVEVLEGKNGATIEIVKPQDLQARRDDAEASELVIDHSGGNIIQHALEQARKQTENGYQLQATPQGTTDYLVIGEVYAGGQPAVQQEATTSGGASATQSVAEAMRCLAQGFGDQNQQVSFVVTNVIQKDDTIAGAPQQPQQVSIQAIPQTNGSAPHYSFYGTAAASSGNEAVATPVQIYTSASNNLAYVDGSSAGNKAPAITTATYQTVGAQSLPSTSGQAIPHPGEEGQRGHLPFTQSLVQVVQRVRETTDEDTAVTILQEMDANADRILNKSGN